MGVEYKNVGKNVVVAEPKRPLFADAPWGVVISTLDERFSVDFSFFFLGLFVFLFVFWEYQSSFVTSM